MKCRNGHMTVGSTSYTTCHLTLKLPPWAGKNVLLKAQLKHRFQDNSLKDKVPSSKLHWAFYINVLYLVLCPEKKNTWTQEPSRRSSRSDPSCLHSQGHDWEVCALHCCNSGLFSLFPQRGCFHQGAQQQSDWTSVPVLRGILASVLRWVSLLLEPW